MSMHSRSKKWIANLTVMLLILALIPASAFAAASTTWSEAGYDNVSESWTPGNTIKYYEGSYVPYRANAEGYVPTGQYIDFDLDYKESGTGALGYDQATDWFIGPYVPYSGSPTLYTEAQIKAYAQATYGKSIIKPNTQFMGTDAFTVANPVELTSGGLTIPAGYTGDTILRYHVVPNVLGYTAGSTTADPGSFIDALMSWYGGSWTMYYQAHLAESGAPNLFEGGTVVLGAGAYTGSSLHVTLNSGGEKTVPLPTRELAKKDILVEKTWANNSDAESVTIKLMGQKGASGTPYVAATITLDGTIDSNTNPEYAPWKGKFVNVPIYYTEGQDIFPITYSIVEDPVPTGFLTPVYGGSAVDTFTVFNEKVYGSLTIHKTVVTNGAVGLTVPDFNITITGPSYPNGDTKTFNQTKGMEQTWNNLLPGPYTVTESGIAAPWSVVVNPTSYTVEGGANTTVDVTVTNTYTPGSLTVHKTVDTNGAVGLTVPDFNITITGPSYPNGDTKTFNQTKGMEQTWNNLIPGSYKVTESGIAAPWSVVVNPTSYTVEGGANTTVDVTVTNTYTPGSLTVHKTVDTNGAVGLTVPDFKITITGPSYPNGDTKTFNQTKGMEQTWNNLIPGPYTVTEPGVAAPWSVVIDPATYNVGSGENTSVDVNVTNSYAAGSLTVHKAVVTNGAVGLTVPDFKITITGPSYPSGDTKTFNQINGMEQTWGNLIPGDYIVKESGISAPWSVVVDPTSYRVESGGDTTVDVTVTNTFATGSLTVLKTIDTNGTVGLKTPDFSITITGPSYPNGNTKTFNTIIGLKQTWTNLIPGPYTVTEPGVAAPWSVVINPETYNVASGEDTTVDVTVTNTYTPGSLTVNKVVETNGAVGLDVPDFNITITGPSYPNGDTKTFNQINGMEQTWTNLVPGDYTVSETGISAPWSVVVDPTSYKVESGESTAVDVTVTNTYTPGSLTVLKTVETNGAVGLTMPDFDITISGPSYPSGDTKTFNQINGMEQTWTGLIPGTYTVTEPGVEAPWSVVIDSATNEVASGEDTTVDVTVTNTYTPGSLTVEKVVETNEAIGLVLPDFDITISGPSYPNGDTKTFNQINGMEQTWTGLIPGTYTVTEPGVEAPWSVVIDSATNEVASGEDTTVDVTVTNTYTPGTITVTKNVDVISEDPDITVNYSFYAALFENQDETMVRVTDVKELKVIDSESATVEFGGLLAGKTYYVFETDSEGNIIETDSDGTIVTPIIPDWTKIYYEKGVVTLTPSMMQGEAAITNVFEPQNFPLYGSITVNKQVTVNGKLFASNRTFYVALFADKELTDMVSEVKPLKMNGNTSTTTEFVTDKEGNPLEAGTTYYIAETDKNGVPLTGTIDELGFEIDIDHPVIVITEEGTTVNIINKFKSEEFPLTGDSANINIWLFLAMLGAAGTMAPFAFRKKEKADK